MEAKFITWMSSAALPSFLTPPFAVIGGTSLLGEFFTRVAAAGENAGDLWICSPFVDQEISTALPMIEALKHEAINLRFMTADEGNVDKALKALSKYRWASFQLAMRRSLHAKIYIFMSARPERHCLIGSHNFTVGGASRNFEAGTLLVSVSGDAVSELIFEIRDQMEQEWRRSTVDMTWPPLSTR